MKFVVVLALFALAVAEPEAEAEADPWLYYNHAGYHPYAYNHGYGLGAYGAYGYGGYGAYPYVYTAPKVEEKVEEAAEVKEAEAPKVVTYPYAGYATYPYAHTYGYTHGYHPYTYAGLHYPRYYANSGGVVHSVAKREADSDSNPESWYSGYGYGGYGYPHHGYGYRGYSGYYNPHRYGAYRGYYYGK